jgi:hypothetical protein
MTGTALPGGSGSLLASGLARCSTGITGPAGLFYFRPMAF